MRPTALSLLPAVALTSLLSLVGPAHAADPARLGGELTPAGGDRAASNDGAIPAWGGNEAQHSGWTWGKPMTPG